MNLDLPQSPFHMNSFHFRNREKKDTGWEETDDGEVMAVEHRDYPVYGLQFHPESVLTPKGMTLIENFLNIAKGGNRS